MQIILFAMVLFIAAFAIHWLLWRIWLPRRQVLCLFCLFEGIFFVATCLICAVPHVALYFAGFWGWLQLAMFYEGAALAYIIIYSGLEQNSPSMTVVQFVAGAAEQGRSPQELYNLFGSQRLVDERIDSLLASKLIEPKGAGYALTKQGLFWAQLFRAYRKLFHLEPGG
jgi:hypothetical protein